MYLTNAVATSPGDPAELRRLAHLLAGRADYIGRIADHLDQSVATMTFAGPAAQDWRCAMACSTDSVRAGVARMQAGAERLLRQAAVVEQQLALTAHLGGI